MTHTEMAWEFADMFGELGSRSDQRDAREERADGDAAVLHRLRRSFAEPRTVGDAMQKRMPNLLLLGYLLRLLEERLIDGGAIGHA